MHKSAEFGKIQHSKPRTYNCIRSSTLIAVPRLLSTPMMEALADSRCRLVSSKCGLLEPIIVDTYITSMSIACTETRDGNRGLALRECLSQTSRTTMTVAAGQFGRTLGTASALELGGGPQPRILCTDAGQILGMRKCRV